MNNFDEVKDLNTQEVSDITGGNYEQGHNAGSAVRNLIAEVGSAIGGFVSGLFGY